MAHPEFPKGARWIINDRKRSKHVKVFEQKFRPYAQHIGFLVHSWNRMQETLGKIFWALSAMDGLTGMRVWYSQNDDRAQRRLLEAAFLGAKQIKLITPELADEIRWLHDKCASLAGRRNSVIHSPFAFDPETQTFGGAHHFGHPRAAELKGKDLLAELKWNRDWADLLADHGEILHICVREKSAPLPDRPLLPVVGQKATRAKKPRRKKAGTQR